MLCRWPTICSRGALLAAPTWSILSQTVFQNTQRRTRNETEKGKSPLVLNHFGAGRNGCVGGTVAPIVGG